MRSDSPGKIVKFLLEPRGEYGKSHYLDETDVLLLEVVVFRVRMVNTQRMLFRGYVVTKNKIQFEFAVLVHACDRSDGVVGNAFCLCENKRVFISIIPPGRKDVIGEVRDAVRV